MVDRKDAALGTTVIDVASGIPIGSIGHHDQLRHPAALRFVPCPDLDSWAGTPGEVPLLVGEALSGTQRVESDAVYLAVTMSSVRVLADLGRLRPDFVVLSPALTQSPRRTDVGTAEIAATVAYARTAGIQVVGTGIEDQPLLDTLLDLGVTLAAGPHIDRRLRPGLSVEAGRTARERSEWLRTRLDVAGSAEDACELVCAVVRSMGLLPSVYIERHGLLRCIAQRGYWQIMDGIPVSMGVIGRTFRTGRTHVVDAARDNEFIEAVPGVTGEISLPLRIDGEVRAVMSVETSRPFAPGEQAEVERMATDLERTLHRTGIAPADTAVHRLAQAAAELTSFTDEVSLIQAVSRLATDVAAMSSSMLAVVNAEGFYRAGSGVGPLRSALSDITPEELGELATDLGGISSCISAGDADGRVRPVLARVRRAGGACVGVFPVRSDGQTIGLLVVADQRPRAFDGELRETLELFAAAVSRTIVHTRLLDRLRRQATLDGLTGIGNRAAFEHAQDEIDAHRLPGTRVAVLFVDLDGFKLVNDRLGHHEGDLVLIRTAEALSSVLREDDGAYRIGGDEFAVLVSGAGLPEAEALAARLTDRLAPMLAEVGAGLSVGIAALEPGEPIAACIRRADDDLYARKVVRA